MHGFLFDKQNIVTTLDEAPELTTTRYVVQHYVHPHLLLLPAWRGYQRRCPSQSEHFESAYLPNGNTAKLSRSSSVIFPTCRLMGQSWIVIRFTELTSRHDIQIRYQFIIFLFPSHAILVYNPFAFSIKFSLKLVLATARSRTFLGTTTLHYPSYPRTFFSMGSRSAAAGLLARQLKQMQTSKDSIPGISCGLHKDNVFEWEVMLMIDDECKYYGGKLQTTLAAVTSANLSSKTTGGFFHARLSFPEQYPLMPPKMKFITPIFHPNSMQSNTHTPTLPRTRNANHSLHLIVYEDGNVCISILHPPEDDKYGYESAAERWNPVQTPETILLSVISMLSSPNDESPANVAAAKMWREDPKEFRKRVRKCVRESLEGEE